MRCELRLRALLPRALALALDWPSASIAVDGGDPSTIALRDVVDAWDALLLCDGAAGPCRSIVALADAARLGFASGSYVASRGAARTLNLACVVACVELKGLKSSTGASETELVSLAEGIRAIGAVFAEACTAAGASVRESGTAVRLFRRDVDYLSQHMINMSSLIIFCDSFTYNNCTYTFL